MKSIIYTLSLVLMILAGACNSGKNSVVDSHPGNGIVKANAEKEPKDKNAADTTRKDSTAKK